MVLGILSYCLFFFFFLTLLFQEILIIVNIQFLKDLTCLSWAVDVMFCNANTVRLFLLYNKEDNMCKLSIIFLLSGVEWKLQDEQNGQQLLGTQEILVPVVEVLFSAHWICFLFPGKSTTGEEY